MRRIDPTTWPRAGAYRHYRPMGAPHLAITVDVDVTELVSDCKARGGSLFATMLHRLIHAANTVPELRQRIRDDDDGEHVVEHDRVDPAFTVGVDGGLFNVATVPLQDDLQAFSDHVAAQSEALRHVTELQPFDGLRDDLVYLSCLPWLRFTSLTHPVHTDRPDTVPRIAWGRFGDDGRGRITMPVNIQAHHALVDGGHLAQFFAALRDPSPTS